MQDGVSAINDLVDKAAQPDPPANDPPANDPPKDPPANDPPQDPPPGDPPANDPPPGPAPIPDYIQNLLKEHGLSSVEELDGFLKKAKEPQKTPEQIQKEQEVYQSSLVDYAVKNDLLKLDDVVTLESMKKKSDEDLVFDQFAKEVKDEILQELEDATDEEILAKVKDAFEKEYPLESQNEKVRQRAEAKIAKAAKEIREPFERSFNDAKSRYDDEISVRNEYPKYQGSMQKLINEIVPGKIDFFTDKDGDQDILADIPLTEDDKKNIIEKLKDKVVNNPETFLLHKSGKVDQIKQNIKDQLDLIVYREYAETGKKKIADTYMGIGIKKGSDTGASNSFAAQQAKAAADQQQASAKDQVLDSTTKK